MIYINHSELCPVGCGCHDVHEGHVSQLHYENDESLVTHLFNPHSLTGEEEYLTSQKIQDGFLIDSSTFNPRRAVLDTQPDQTGGFKNCHFTKNMFTHTFGDYPLYPFFDPMK